MSNATLESHRPRSVEPEPDWPKAYKIWGWVWYFYVYGYSSLFLVIALVSSVVLTFTLVHHGCRQRPLGLLVLVVVLLLGAVNSCHVIFDPRSRSVASLPVAHHFLKCLASPLVVTVYFLYNKFLIRLTKYELYRCPGVDADAKDSASGLRCCCGCGGLMAGQAVLLTSFYASVLALNWMDVYGQSDDHRYWHAATRVVFITWCLISSFSIFHEACVLAHYADKSRKILTILQKRRSKAVQAPDWRQSPRSTNSERSLRCSAKRNETRAKLLKRDGLVKTYRNLGFGPFVDNSSVGGDTSEGEANRPAVGRGSTAAVVPLPVEAENSFRSDGHRQPLLATSKEETWLQMSTLSVAKIRRKGKNLVEHIRSMKSGSSGGGRRKMATGSHKLENESSPSRSSSRSSKIDRSTDRSTIDSDISSSGSERKVASCSSPEVCRPKEKSNPETHPSPGRPRRSHRHHRYYIDDTDRNGDRRRDFSEGYSADDDESRRTSTAIRASNARPKVRVSSLPCCLDVGGLGSGPRALDRASVEPSAACPHPPGAQKFARPVSLANLRMNGTHRKISRASYLVATLGFCSSFANIYGLFGVFGVFSNVPEADAWPWLAFQAILKFLDVALSLSLTWIVSVATERKFKMPRRKTKS